jgi:hypothetical protein
VGKIGKSWLRRLISHDPQTLGKQLSPLEKRFISFFGALLFHSKWAEDLAFAFGCAAGTIRKIRKSDADTLFEDHVTSSHRLKFCYLTIREKNGSETTAQGYAIQEKGIHGAVQSFSARHGGCSVGRSQTGVWGTE